MTLTSRHIIIKRYGGKEQSETSCTTYQRQQRVDEEKELSPPKSDTVHQQNELILLHNALDCVYSFYLNLCRRRLRLATLPQPANADVFAFACE